MGAARPKPDHILIQASLPRDLIRQVDHLAVDADVWRVEMIERLLRLGIERLAKEGAS